MCTISYYKVGNQWFLDFPEYLEQGTAEDLERIGSFHDFLELAAAGQSTVHFKMAVKPFEGADLLILVGSSGEQTGGYYYLQSFQGKPLEIELWYNGVIYQFTQKELPQKLYIQQLV
ncbi:MAG: DUF6717 family protein [Flavisolibacter sp.]